MASISSLMGSTSSSSSIYGSRNTNIISGLASGLDTETMIEGLVESYQQKITGLQQDRTKVQWQQEAYQSVSDKLVEFYRNYMSFAYSSNTNLFSSSFFNSAVNVIAGGQYADKVSATGRSSSEIILNSVAQLAQAARYTTSGGDALKTGVTESAGRLTATSEAIGDTVNVSNLEGSITLKYGDKDLTIDFGELELFGAGDGGTGDIDPAKLQAAIEEKLSSQVVSVGQNTYFGDDLVKVNVDADGNISFSDKRNAGNKVEVTNVSGKLADALDAKPDEGATSIKLKDMNAADAYTETKTPEYLSGKTITFNLDGKSKTLTIGEGLSSMQEVVDNLNDQLKDNFGAGKINLNWDDKNKTISFDVASGSTLSVASEAGEAMGLGDVGLTSYLNTGKTLGDLLGADMGGLDAARGTGAITSETVTEKDENGTEVTKTVYKDEEGRLTDQNGYLINEDGKKYYNLTINGKSVGNFTEDDALDKVMNTINNSDAGVKVQFSQITNQFVFTAKDTGEGGRIEIADNTLGAALFGAVNPNDTTSLDNNKASYVAGQDAIFQVEVNGKTMNLARSTNAVEIDGMTLNFKKTFNVGTVNGVITSGNIEDTMFDANGEAVTFKAETDADTIVDAVKKMVEDYNEIMNSVKELYTTRPAQTSSGKSYEPLTDEEADGMTDTEIKNYEEKAKQGILYMDSDLSSLYNSLRSVLTGNSGLLKSIGLSTEYSNGNTTLKLDETALRQAISEDPEAVKDAFVSSKDNGAATDGLMAQMYKVVNNYAATSGATKGILIEKAGSKYSPTAALDNTMLDKLNDIDDEIEEWQDKMSDKVDYYTNKFTQLEMLINQMNSQSSALSGLMGG